MASDYGSQVAVYRSDGQAVSEADKARVRAAAKSLRIADGDRIGPYDGFDLRFGSCGPAGGPEGVAVFLSGHFLEEIEEDGTDPDAALADEGPVAEEFAEDLARALGSDFRCEASSGYW